MNGEIIIHTDGGARGNPGPSACSFVAETNGEVLEKKSKYLGVSTNNVAEYQGVILALIWLSEKINEFGDEIAITFFLDSELIVRQILGTYKVKDEKLKGLYYEVNGLINRIGKNIFFKNIPRSKNKIADYLVNEELDKKH